MSIRKENARINDLVNLIQITSDPMNIRKPELAQLQTLNLELSRLQTEVCHVRTSVGRTQSNKKRDAEKFHFLAKKIIPWVQTIYRNRSRLNH